MSSMPGMEQSSTIAISSTSDVIEKNLVIVAWYSREFLCWSWSDYQKLPSMKAVVTRGSISDQDSQVTLNRSFTGL